MLAEIGWPVLDRIHLFGDFAISPHGIGIALGFLFGAWILGHEGAKRGVSVDHTNTMVFWALIGTIIGARLFYVIGHYSEFDGVADMLALWNGGLTLLGGIAGAILINVPRFRRYGYSFFQVMDPAVIGFTAQRPVHCFAKAPLFDVPVFGALMHALGMVPAYRGTDDKASVPR